MLHEDLENLECYPFHMPGHKRNSSFCITGCEKDITEITGFDNLHSPSGVLKELEDDLAELYSASKSFLSVNGSSGCIQAAVFALCSPGDEILIARNCHKSVYNACEMRQLKTYYIDADYIDRLGCYGKIKQENVDRALKTHPNAKAIIITSPTYEGIISNITAPIPIITDAAHGAHFPFGNFPKYPKSEIVISSLHKTLPCLTQTAILNVYDKALILPIKKYMDMFETTSPSYLLMNSVSVATEYLQNSKGDFINFDNMLTQLYAIPLNNLEFEIFDDRSRILVSCGHTNIYGEELAKILREKYKIEIEYSAPNYINLISTVADEPHAFTLLGNALSEIDNTLKTTEQRIIPKIPKAEFYCFPSEIGKTKTVCLDEAAGEISAELIAPYPPSAPIIAPGEIFDDEIINYIKVLKAHNVAVSSLTDINANTVLTKA